MHSSNLSRSPGSCGAARKPSAGSRLRVRGIIARRLLAAGSLVVLVPIASVAGQVPGLSASFRQPSGPISGTTPIDIYLHLALDPNASPFAFDGTSPSTFFGLPPAITVIGILTSFTNAFTTASISNNLCVGPGTPSCNPSSAYTFTFPASDPYYFQNMLSLAPGATLDFLFGSFIPRQGGAPSGTYTFSGAAANVIVNGFDASGKPGVEVVTLAQACAGVSLAGCEFSQRVVGTITASPEPASLVLVVTGLVGVAGFTRRRRPT